MIRRAEGHDEAEMGSTYARIETQQQRNIYKLNIQPLYMGNQAKQSEFIFKTYFVYPKPQPTRDEDI